MLPPTSTTHSAIHKATGSLVTGRLQINMDKNIHQRQFLQPDTFTDYEPVKPGSCNIGRLSIVLLGNSNCKSAMILTSFGRD